jgi:hypothetical protein
MSSDTSSNLKLPYIMPAQAQKHVTHNEAVRALDVLVHLAVIDRTTTAPPAAPPDGARYIVPAGATGPWAGTAGRIAAWQDDAWAFYQPAAGFCAWISAEARLAVYTGSAWVPVSLDQSGALDGARRVGINASADDTNRLTVRARASLFDGEVADHRLVVNKRTVAATASLVLQTAYSGRAEIGLTGDDHLSFKVSPDGATWRTALLADKDRGSINAPNGLAVAASVEPALEARSATTPTAVVIDTVVNGEGGGIAACRVDLPNQARRLGFSAGGTVRSGTRIPVLSAAIEFWADAAWTLDSSHPSHIRFLTTPAGSTTRMERLRIDPDGTTRPAVDNAHTLGRATARWATIFAVNGTINTSDARDKIVTGNLDAVGPDMVDRVAPVLFRWKSGGMVWSPDAGAFVEQPGLRLHAGFLAQDVKAAMAEAGSDFAAWGLDDVDDPASRQWLRPDELVAVLWAALRETRARLEALEARMPA